jgi:Tol biopolymer transport system component/DNA-binding winged helix-turn-helix (wHTH) protein
VERPSSTERGFKFEPFELNLQTRELRKFDVRIRLADQPFQILTMLLERPGEIVTREDLQKRLWPDGTFVDFELSLNAAIKKLRQALGDSADEPRFIETFPRRGYRFIAPIEEIIPATSVATPEKRPSRGVIVGIVALILIAVLVFALYRVRVRDKAFVAFQEMKITRVTATGKTVSAAISPDGKYVAHVMSGPDGQSVWLRHMASGSDVQILPAIKVEYGNLNFSADGNSIYYGRGEQEGFPGKGSIYETALFGGVTHRIITDADAGPHQFSVSPDGKRLAFIRSDQKQGNAVMIANSDGTGVRKLAERTGDNFFSPVAWSPDGKGVACGDYDASRHKASVILIPAQGGPEKVLATGPWAIVVALEWLPTGRGLLAAGGAQENCCWQLWDISYPTGEVHRLTNDLDSYTGISLAADAQTLVSTQIHGVSNVWVASDPKLERAQQITFSDGWNAGIYWTPEGKIVYNSNATGVFNIWITTPDGSNPKQLTDDRTFCTSPRVTADGRYIVFLSGRSGMSHVWRMDIDGSNPIELTKGNHQDLSTSHRMASGSCIARS